MFAVIAAVVVVAIAAVVGVKMTHHSTAAGGSGTVPRATTSLAPGSTAPAVSAPSTVVGPSGNPASWPAAQSNPPSLDGAYSNDLRVVTETIDNYRDWLFAHPDPAFVDSFMLPSSPDYNNLKGQMALLKSRGLHARAGVSEVDFIKVTEPPKPQVLPNGQRPLIAGHPAMTGGLVVVIFGSTSTNPVVYLDSSGQVSFTAPVRGQVAIGLAFAQGPTDGRWRISSEVELHPNGGIASLEQP